MINEISNRSNKKLVKVIFDEMKKGKLPNFGSPETRCDKCMFHNIACFPSPKYVGCLGGWKEERETNEK